MREMGYAYAVIGGVGRPNSTRRSAARSSSPGARSASTAPLLELRAAGPRMSVPVPEPRHEYYESQRIRLHYAVWGDGEKPPLLLIHGGQDHCRNWDFVAARLVDSYTLYAPDLRGHGDSGWAIGGMYSLPEFVYDVSVLADNLPRPLAVIGHSLGGAIALQYAGTFPEAGLSCRRHRGLGAADDRGAARAHADAAMGAAHARDGAAKTATLSTRGKRRRSG